MSEEEYEELLDLFRENNLTQYGIDKLYGEIIDRQIEKDQEIERLNNIIEHITNHFEFLKMNSTGGNKEFMEDILDYIKALQELKGADKE